MLDSLDSLRDEILARIEKSGREAEIEQIRVEALGRKGRLTQLLRGLKDLPLDQRPAAAADITLGHFHDLFSSLPGFAPAFSSWQLLAPF
jgi:phenylalanyl-tRNA synthetase alpha subunit